MGCASIAQRSMIPAIKALPEQFELTAIASRSAGKAAEFGSLFNTVGVTGYDQLLAIPGIEAIYMPLPTGLHEEWIDKALNAGKHVLVEKSLAADFNSASRLIGKAKEKRLVLQENFMFRHHSQHSFTWELLRENKLGDLRLFRSQFGFPPLDKHNFRYDPQAGGGSLLDAGAYTVKASQWFLGRGLELLNAVLYMDSDRAVDIYGNATLISKSGVVAQLSFGFDNFYQCNYELWGSKGRVLASKAFTPKPTEQPLMIWEGAGQQDARSMPADNHFENILKDFHSAILEKDFSRYADELLDHSRILTAIQQHAKKITYKKELQ
jgi:NDP-hexose-3-ketoreductase